MDQRRIGSTDLTTSPIGFGTWEMSTTSYGAIDVNECVVKFDIAAPISPEEFWDFRSEISEVLREKLRNLSGDEKERIANEVQHAVREFFPGGHMRFPAQMIIVSGTKRS